MGLGSLCTNYEPACFATGLTRTGLQAPHAETRLKQSRTAVGRSLVWAELLTPHVHPHPRMPSRSSTLSRVLCFETCAVPPVAAPCYTPTRSYVTEEEEAEFMWRARQWAAAYE